MDEKEIYIRILRLFADCIESLKGYFPSDQRLVDSYPLTIKFFFHAASLYSLMGGTDLSPIIEKPGFIFDHASMKILARALFETYLTFHYIFIDPKNDDEFEFRYCAWQLSGFGIREEMDPISPEFRKQKEIDMKFMAGMRERLIQTEKYKSLKAKQQKAVFKGRKWRDASWPQIARMAGLGRQFSKILYSLLSSYAHSDSLSATQIEQAVTKEEQEDLTQGTLILMLPIVSKMVLTYTEKFQDKRIESTIQ